MPDLSTRLRDATDAVPPVTLAEVVTRAAFADATAERPRPGRRVAVGVVLVVVVVGSIVGVAALRRSSADVRVDTPITAGPPASEAGAPTTTAQLNANDSIRDPGLAIQLESSAIELFKARGLVRFGGGPTVNDYGGGARSLSVQLADGRGFLLAFHQGVMTTGNFLDPVRVMGGALPYTSPTLPSEYKAASRSTATTSELYLVSQSVPSNFIDIWDQGPHPMTFAELEVAALTLIAASPVHAS